jgi:hypothetical protein
MGVSFRTSSQKDSPTLKQLDLIDPLAPWEVTVAPSAPCYVRAEKQSRMAVSAGFPRGVKSPSCVGSGGGMR